MKIVKARYPLAVRFWRRVVCGMTTLDCWTWTGAKSGRPGLKYGQISVNRSPQLAHRVAWEIHFGPVPVDMKVCHRCDNPSCVNPGHLFLGTIHDNNADRHAKGRSRGGSNKGATNGQCKLTEAIVADIRASSCSLNDAAERYGVTFQTISDIRRRKIWRHVP